jgi:hypothetical protein
MPLTYTGRLVKPGNGAHPSLIDIAVGLSRQPRFAGQTRRQWSVLDHTLFGDELIKLEPTWNREAPAPAGLRGFRLAWLLHDAHEAITGDVPTDVKRDTTLGKAQVMLDGEIMDAFYPGGIAQWGWWHDFVKDIDRKCLLAEAAVVGPPAAAATFDAPDPVAAKLLEDQVCQPNPLLGVPPYEVDQRAHPAVQAYIQRMLELL